MPFLFFDCVLINCDRLVITIGLNSGPGVQNHANLFPKQLSMTLSIRFKRSIHKYRVTPVLKPIKVSQQNSISQEWNMSFARNKL